MTGAGYRQAKVINQITTPEATESTIEHAESLNSLLPCVLPWVSAPCAYKNASLSSAQPRRILCLRLILDYVPSSHYGGVHVYHPPAPICALGSGFLCGMMLSLISNVSMMSSHVSKSRWKTDWCFCDSFCRCSRLSGAWLHTGNLGVSRVIQTPVIVGTYVLWACHHYRLRCQPRPL